MLMHSTEVDDLYMRMVPLIWSCCTGRHTLSAHRARKLIVKTDRQTKTEKDPFAKLCLLPTHCSVVPDSHCIHFPSCLLNNHRYSIKDWLVLKTWAAALHPPWEVEMNCKTFPWPFNNKWLPKKSFPNWQMKPFTNVLSVNHLDSLSGMQVACIYLMVNKWMDTNLQWW